jgi:hypothetical protein
MLPVDSTLCQYFIDVILSRIWDFSLMILHKVIIIYRHQQRKKVMNPVIKNPVIEAINDVNSVRFFVLNERRSITFSAAKEAATVLLKTATDKTSLIFNDVVIARSAILRYRNEETAHVFQMIDLGGPFTAEEFIKLMTYDPLLDILEWGNSYAPWVRYKEREKKDKS